MQFFDVLLMVVIVAFVVMQFTSARLPKGKAVKKQLDMAKKQRQAVLEKLKNEVQTAHNGGQKAPSPTSTIKAPKAKVSVPESHPLHPVAAEMPEFREKEFLKGAKQAYGFFQEALKHEDWEALENLCAPHLIHDLRANDAKAKPTTGVKLTALTSEVTGRTAFVDVKFEPNKKTDSEIWTFAKSLNSDDPNWELEEIQKAS